MSWKENARSGGLYVVQISVHGLIRGSEPELGRDADTGGQVRYVLDLTRELALHPDVERVDLLTRRVVDRRMSEAYAVPFERIGEGARIVRLPAGPRRYLRKEVLWPHLDGMVDQAILHVRQVGRLPDIIHGHYADGGYAGSRLAAVLGVPFLFTAHSLGRVKKQYLLRAGMGDRLESWFHISRRIEAEEEALSSAARVVVSTQHEIDEQYELYDQYRPDRKQVIAPGMDLERFRPPAPGDPEPAIREEIGRFLRRPDLPMVLALARPDERKNLRRLVEAFGGEGLRERANLVLFVGSRTDVSEMDPGSKRVMTDLLLEIDRQDLYGHVAYPKSHSGSDVPEIFRLATRSGGVFVLPTDFELFGLTLVEAAASGLPVVATRNGGPAEIVGRCGHGLLIDRNDPDTLARAIRRVLDDPDRWREYSARGAERARRYYGWERHVSDYLGMIEALRGGDRGGASPMVFRSRLPAVDRLLVGDIDNTIVGDDSGLRRLMDRLGRAGDSTAFGVATGRNLESAVDVLTRHAVPMPDVLITSVGSEIHYGRVGGESRLVPDRNWTVHIDYRWDADRVRSALRELPGLELQPPDAQRQHKVSCFLDPVAAPDVAGIRAHLRQDELAANVILSHGRYLDVIPIRASKGRAVRYVALRWGLPMERVLVAGDSGNDADMLRGETLGVVVGNHSPELRGLTEDRRVYFADASFATGVLEGVDHYDFLGAIRIPEDEA